MQAPVAAGPADTAARLFTEYGPQLYRFCLGRMRSREEAEDAVQSTFLRVYRALDRGEVPQYEAAWLYKIAHNVCLSRREVMGRRSRLETPQDLDEIEWALAAPESQHDELSGLADALAAMPPNLRQAVLLREWQGLSYAEVANAMGTTVSAVETLIFRARKHLAAELDPERSKQKTLAGLLAGLLGRFSLAAPAAKLSVGGALLAVCGAGVGLGVALGVHHGSVAATTAGSTTAAAPAPPTSAPHAASPASPVGRAVVRTAHARHSTPPPAAIAPPAAGPPSPAAAVSPHARAVAPFLPVAVSPTTTPAPLLPPAPAPPPTQLPAVPVNPPVLPPLTVPGVTTPELVPTPPPVEPPAVSVPTLPAPPPAPAATLPAVSVP